MNLKDDREFIPELVSLLPLVSILSSLPRFSLSARRIVFSAIRLD